MSDLDQFQIIQEIVRRASAVAGNGWTEMIISYNVDDSQSNFGNSYLVEENGSTREKSLPCPYDLDVWLRKLRAHLSQTGRDPFSSCRLHVHADGKYEASYGYGELDWDSLALADWNFFPKRKKQQ